jgi:predicted DCC family thiol-disulfide oxidoreductase YuxK
MTPGDHGVRWPARTVVFDGDCAFCQRWIRVGRRLDWRQRISWRARTEPGLREEFPQLSREATQRRIVSIRPDGETCGGFFAVRDLMRHLPLTCLPALALYLPGVSRVGVPVYEWIAKNRYRLGGRSMEACDLPAAVRPAPAAPPERYAPREDEPG